jgi:hypothetical protein
MPRRLLVSPPRRIKSRPRASVGPNARERGIIAGGIVVTNEVARRPVPLQSAHSAHPSEKPGGRAAAAVQPRDAAAWGACLNFQKFKTGRYVQGGEPRSTVRALAGGGDPGRTASRQQGLCQSVEASPNAFEQCKVCLAVESTGHRWHGPLPHPAACRCQTMARRIRRRGERDARRWTT